MACVWSLNLNAKKIKVERKWSPPVEWNKYIYKKKDLMSAIKPQ